MRCIGCAPSCCARRPPTAVLRHRATASALVARIFPRQVSFASPTLWERPLTTARVLPAGHPEPVPPPDDSVGAAVGGPSTEAPSPAADARAGATDASDARRAIDADALGGESADSLTAGPGPASAVSPGEEPRASSTSSSSSPSPSSLSPPTPFFARGEAAVSPGAGHRERRIEALRVSLLAALSSLDRGLAANTREAAEVDELCSQLEKLGGAVRLEPMAGAAAGTNNGSGGGGATSVSGGGAGSAAAADLLPGTWRLIYSSGFNSGSLGGRRPGPPAALFPTILGQVYQRIDPETAKLDNIVELLFSYGPPDWGLLGLGEQALGRGLAGLGRQLGLEVRPEQLPAPLRELLLGRGGGGGGSPETRRQGQWGQQEGRRESPAARLTLRHDYEVSSPATVRIVYEETYGELVGNDLFSALPRLEAPSLPEPLRPPKFLRSATFEVTFLDEMMRITRGDRGELRVYLRDSAAEAAVSGSGAAAAAAGAMALDYDD